MRIYAPAGHGSVIKMKVARKRFPTASDEAET